jgi:hypothetical protein
MPLRPLVLATAMTLAAALAPAAGELKQNPRAVLELFTSQGCSSCPAADALLKELAAKPEIIALAYHVDYWDYVGWPDTFGDEEHSDRQRDYAAAWGSSRIFTPQLIVNGRQGVVASRAGEVHKAMAGAALDLPVKLAASGEVLEIDIPSDPALAAAVVWLVSYLDKADVRIDRGENEGRTVGYTQIVTHRQILGMWDPATGTHLKLPMGEILDPPANGGVILVQQEKAGLPGRILGAASFLR